MYLYLISVHHTVKYLLSSIYLINRIVIIWRSSLLLGPLKYILKCLHWTWRTVENVLSIVYKCGSFIKWLPTVRFLKWFVLINIAVIRATFIIVLYMLFSRLLYFIKSCSSIVAKLWTTTFWLCVTALRSLIVVYIFIENILCVMRVNRICWFLLRNNQTWILKWWKDIFGAIEIK